MLLRSNIGSNLISYSSSNKYNMFLCNLYTILPFRTRFPAFMKHCLSVHISCFLRPFVAILAITVPLNIMQHPILIQPLPELCKAPFNIMYTYLKSQQELIIYGHGQAELVTTKELASERVLLAEMRLKYSLFYGW